MEKQLFNFHRASSYSAALVKRRRASFLSKESNMKDVDRINAMMENQVNEVVKKMSLKGEQTKNIAEKEPNQTSLIRDDMLSERSEIGKGSHSSLFSSQTTHSQVDLTRRRGGDLFSVDPIPGRRMQYQLYRFNMRQKALSSKAVVKSKQAESTEPAKKKQPQSDFHLPLLEDPELLSLRKPWMLGVFDFEEKNVNAYEKFLETNLNPFTWRNKIALETRIRFTLPMDLSTLKDITPVDYLKEYCKVTDDQEFIYSKCFGTMRPGTTITPSDLMSAVSNRLTGVFTPEQQEEFTYLTDLDKYESFAQAEMNGLMGLAERLYGIQNLQVSHPDLWLLLPGPLEKADFYNLRGKIRNVDLCERLRNLLWRLEDASRLDGSSMDEFLLDTSVDIDETTPQMSLI